MENAKFTPGPWTYSKYEGFGDTRFYVAQQEGAPYTPNYSDVATIICETVQIERKAIQEANARLIAAAPELLEALQRALNVLHATGAMDEARVAQDAISKAIAR